MFLEDIIKANLKEVFIGYEVECSYCCKISRDADVFVDDVPAESMVEKLKEKVKKRKIGAICRFVYDRKMPDDFLDALVEALGINREELVPGDKHLKSGRLGVPSQSKSGYSGHRQAAADVLAWDERKTLYVSSDSQTGYAALLSVSQF